MRKPNVIKPTDIRPRFECVVGISPTPIANANVMMYVPGSLAARSVINVSSLFYVDMRCFSAMCMNYATRNWCDNNVQAALRIELCHSGSKWWGVIGLAYGLV